MLLRNVGPFQIRQRFGFFFFAISICVVLCGAEFSYAKITEIILDLR